MKYISLLIISAILLISCKNQEELQGKNPALENIRNSPALINSLNRGLMRIVSEDLFTPPVASRIYAYSNLAANETLNHSSELAFSHKVRGLDSIKIGKMNGIKGPIAMIEAFCITAKALVYRDAMVDSMKLEILEKYELNQKESDEESENFGEAVAKAVLDRANSDGYNQTRNLPKYSLINKDFAWKPTAPLYGEALEPHWNKIKPFVMDSASEFRAKLVFEFSKVEGSTFHDEAMKVYELVNDSDSSDLNTAIYWDCNPGPTQVDGHRMQVRKQNTPGGHWIGIHAILAEQDSIGLDLAVARSAKLAMGIADAFIAAWDTKYHYNLLRPETYINTYIDPDWLPRLESPLFPEYTSAHSLVSSTAAAILSKHYKDRTFIDDTNVFFGIPPKEFNSISKAALEAANSRVLGGIHYVFGCDDAFEQGIKLGEKINTKITLD
jgi:hypothetical protein